MKKNITVKQFVDNYLALKNENTKQTLLNSIKTVDYMEYSLLTYYADRILANSCIDENGNLHIDSCKKYLMTVFTLISAYTSIECSPENWVEEYDLLNKNALIPVIINRIPENAVKDLENFVQMKFDDLMTNTYETHAYFNQLFAKLLPTLTNGIESFTDAAAKFFENVDEKKLEKVLKAFK